jgi:hypothetical protein
MLRPPSEYESTKISLSSHVAKINNLFFDSAIIFFVPKVANKGVDLASLQCTIVQITDRGEWGKEEESFTVDASSFSNRKYRSFDLTTDAEYSLKIIPPPELRMGILEIYFDPDLLSTNHPNHHMSTTENPSTIDISALTSAISASGAASVAAIQAASDTANKRVKKIVEKSYVPVQWSAPANHIAIPVDNDRMAVEIYNNGNVAIAFDTFLDITLKAATPQLDNLIQPGGKARLEASEANKGVLLYRLTGFVGANTAIALINQDYPTP